MPASLQDVRRAFGLPDDLMHVLVLFNGIVRMYVIHASALLCFDLQIILILSTATISTLQFIVQALCPPTGHPGRIVPYNSLPSSVVAAAAMLHQF